jgi:dipeptidyl aminopeptidase/acylaminoacyl peptidase
MPKLTIRAIFVALAVSLIYVGSAFAAESIDAARYDRASRFFPDNRDQLVLNAAFVPHWRTSGSERFTYRKELGDGRVEFVEVMAATGRRRPAFDHAVVAAGLSKVESKEIEPARLPFADYEESAPDAISFPIDGKTYTCSTRKPDCREVPANQGDPLAVPSPDGQWLAFLEDGNLWIRSADGKTRFALTTDAAPHYRYAGMLESTRGVLMTGAAARALAVKDGKPIDGPPGPPAPPVVLWAPDSKYLLSHRLDERELREITLVQSTPTDGSSRPLASTWRYAMPNDPAVATAQPWVFDIASRTGRAVDIPALPTTFLTPVESRDARSRFSKAMSLQLVDAATGRARELIAEAGKTFVESADLGQRPMVHVLKNGDVLWFSERDGYGRLYLYDGITGKLKRPLTQGPWTIRSLLRVDEEAGTVFVAATRDPGPGIDPYYRNLYRIRLADGAVTRLTPEEADHSVAALQGSIINRPDSSFGFSPSGRYFVDTYARTDLPSKTVLRRADGRWVAEVEQADISRLKASGFVMPERFSALAADGKTPLYGIIFRPSDIDPAKRYPVIDNPYPGPQSRRASPDLLQEVFSYHSAQAIAELGFIVIATDGRGSQGRTKAFREESYGGLGQAGHLDDHVAVIRELGRRYPYMDLDRVGIYGTSGGGYATVKALATFPGFFKVGVADAGNHDQRGYIAVWGETYNGPEDGTNYTAAANRLFAENIKGKLFLLHGDMDSNVLPSHTLQVADALIKANRDFDLLIVPNAGHGTLEPRSYALRRAWDFLVRHLMDVEPPTGYAFPPAPAKH